MIFNFVKSIPALFADLANAVFAVHIVAWVYEVNILWWYYIVAMPLAMLPDLDALPELFRKGKIGAGSEYPEDHRELLHIPLLFMPVGITLWYWLGFWGLLFLVATALHFVNDLYGTGWGVPLFKPFTKDRYKLFTDSDNELSLSLSNFVRKIPHQRLVSEIKQYGNENWIDDYYWHWSTISVIEYSLFILSLYLVVSTLL